MAQKQLTPLDMNGNAITGLPTTPSGANDAASKAYVDANGGTDEVVIDNTEPTNTDVLWIDPDDPTGASGGGSGDVVGPSSSTDNTLAAFDGTTGKLLQGTAISLTSNNVVNDGIDAQAGVFGGATAPGASNGVYTNDIKERTTDSGVTVDGVLIKDGKVDGLDLANNAMGVVVHGSTASTARPAGYAQVTWIGTVEPTNAAANDIWYNG